MAKDFFHTINLEDHLEISAAIAAKLGVPGQELLGRKFYYKQAGRSIYLFDNGKYRFIDTLALDPPAYPELDGSSGGVVGIAEIALSGHRAVFLNSEGFRYAEPVGGSEDSVVGITTGAAAAGAKVSVRTFGQLSETSWSWTPNEPIYLAANGLLSQSPPTTGAVVVLAHALSSTSLFIRIQQPTYLES